MRDKAVDFSSLPERVAAASFNQKDYPIELHPDKDTTFVATFEMIVLLKRLGYTRIMVFAERGEHRWDDPLGFFFVPVEQVIDGKNEAIGCKNRKMTEPSGRLKRLPAVISAAWSLRSRHPSRRRAVVSHLARSAHSRGL